MKSIFPIKYFTLSNRLLSKSRNKSQKRKTIRKKQKSHRNTNSNIKNYDYKPGFLLSQQMNR